MLVHQLALIKPSKRLALDERSKLWICVVRTYSISFYSYLYLGLCSMCCALQAAFLSIELYTIITTFKLVFNQSYTNNTAATLNFALGKS
mgnify:CR=1 FL=1